MTYDVIESATLTEDVKGKRWTAMLIKAGWGSKGYYSEDVLKRDGPTVFKAGTPIFLDHQTPEERELKPFGSVQNFAGELATDAVWDVEEGGLVAEVEFFEHQQPLVRSLAKKVGLSIRARTTAERGTMEGRNGRIITGLLNARSVDLVVRAGAGGQLLDVLESEVDTEMEEQQMSEEVLEAIKKLSESQNEKFEAIDRRFAEIEESLTTQEEPTVEEPEVTEEAAIDIEKTVAELVAAELAKQRVAVAEESAHDEGTEENVDDVEESAVEEIKLPRYWAAKENK